MKNGKYIALSVFILLLLMNITTNCGVALSNTKSVCQQKQTNATEYYDDMKLVSIKFLF